MTRCEPTRLQGILLLGLILCACVSLPSPAHAAPPGRSPDAPTNSPPMAPSQLPLPLLLAASAVITAPDTVTDAPGFVESLYQAGEDYRAETEIVRLLHGNTNAREVPPLELARAKLYYRQGRRRDAALMLYSLLDRHPRSAVTVPATRLLMLSQLREENLSAAAQVLWAFQEPGATPPSLAEFAAPPPGAVDVERTVAWSTALPGAGFLALGQPGKASAALGLNLFFLGAAVSAARNDLPGAALLLGLVELTLYQGQRNATREEALRHNQRLRARQTEDWASAHGEKSLLSFALTTHF